MQVITEVHPDTHFNIKCIKIPRWRQLATKPLSKPSVCPLWSLNSLLAIIPQKNTGGRGNTLRGSRTLKIENLE